LVDANFEIVENQSPYNPEFVSKILEGSEALKMETIKQLKLRICGNKILAKSTRRP
jgi:hypothetical protein